MDLFDERVVMFESVEDGERLVVTCEPTGAGGIVVREVCEGNLARWCFEESPHTIETFIDHEGLRALLRFYDVDTLMQVARMLSISFSDYDCGHRVRSLLRELHVPFDVVERPIDRAA